MPFHLAAFLSLAVLFVLPFTQAAMLNKSADIECTNGGTPVCPLMYECCYIAPNYSVCGRDCPVEERIEDV